MTCCLCCEDVQVDELSICQGCREELAYQKDVEMEARAIERRDYELENERTS